MIREGVFDDPQVIDLLTLHAAAMLAHSPVDTCHFLDLTGLQAPGVSFYTLWDGDALAAMGALKAHDAGLGEIKSMRSAPAYLGTGRGRAMLAHIIEEARAKGLAWVALETGSGAAFDPAIGLYRAHGFTACAPFAAYRATDFNRFMALDL
ncbi:GNAT family N-acetyltransferase [Sphingomonas oligophenolica]|uniref:N-acetyltransferase n=1 Tax=Sphingomonas oligophenolica TaxID=301154 RepID=A0A502CCH1_9SPHN|nr:GNAT family N-acetyltransferase [Sphingomonas oligophenolica]TPG10412.1 N-acetyltransferase [Sphingomonas oligophenolica]